MACVLSIKLEQYDWLTFNYIARFWKVNINNDYPTEQYS